VNVNTPAVRKLAEALLQSGERPSSVVSSAYQTLTRQGLLSDTELHALSRVDPVAETMFLMMAADGKLSAEERVAIRGAIRGLTGDALQDGIIDVMLENYQTQLVRDGREGCLKRIVSILGQSSEDAEGAFALAAAVALVDRRVDATETELIHQLAQWFGISATRAEAILNQLQDASAGQS
jgi:tellurite resistance protein